MKSLTPSSVIDDKWYFTGKPCKRGHIAPRLRSNRVCRDCSYEKREKYEHSEAYSEWKAQNRSKVCSDWQKRNKGKVNAVTRKYQASRLQRTPPWLTASHYLLIEQQYNKAQRLREETGEDWHVDHIVPLQGETVSGLHVPWNLQVVPASVNLRKNNRFEEPYEDS